MHGSINCESEHEPPHIYIYIRIYIYQCIYIYIYTRIGMLDAGMPGQKYRRIRRDMLVRIIGGIVETDEEMVTQISVQVCFQG